MLSKKKGLLNVEVKENLIWDSFSSGVHHLYVSVCLRCHVLVVWDVLSIQGCGYDCNVMCAFHEAWFSFAV